MEIRNALTFVIEIDRIESTGINTVVTRQKDRIQKTARDRTQNTGDRTQKTEPGLGRQDQERQSLGEPTQNVL